MSDCLFIQRQNGDLINMREKHLFLLYESSVISAMSNTFSDSLEIYRSQDVQQMTKVYEGIIKMIKQGSNLISIQEILKQED